MPAIAVFVDVQFHPTISTVIVSGKILQRSIYGVPVGMRINSPRDDVGGVMPDDKWMYICGLSVDEIREERLRIRATTYVDTRVDINNWLDFGCAVDQKQAALMGFTA